MIETCGMAGLGLVREKQTEGGLEGSVDEPVNIHVRILGGAKRTWKYLQFTNLLRIVLIIFTTFFFKFTVNVH